MKLENLSALFENGAYTLVLQKDGETIYKDFGRGVGRQSPTKEWRQHDRSGKLDRYKFSHRRHYY